MMIPTGDTAPHRTAPIFNTLFILANIVVFYEVFRRPEGEIVEIVNAHALKPDQWKNVVTFVTSMFLHGGLLHLIFNMLFLWIVGDNVEDRLGHLPYLVFYFLAGIAGSIAHTAISLTMMTDMQSVSTVGASGAISGVMGAYLIFFPGSRINFRLWVVIFFPKFRLPAWGAIGLWVGTQVLLAWEQIGGKATGQSQMVAVFAHLGGFAFGFLVALLVRMLGKAPPPSKPKGS